MASFSIRVGAILIIAGIAGYILTGAASITALIPAAIGVALVVLGLVGVRRPDLRKHVMHAALLVALIGLAGSIGGLIALPGALAAGEGVRPAIALRAVMALMLIIYLGVGVKSFIDARRARS